MRIKIYKPKPSLAELSVYPNLVLPTQLIIFDKSGKYLELTLKEAKQLLNFLQKTIK
jgi:hypothetical protein